MCMIFTLFHNHGIYITFYVFNIYLLIHRQIDRQIYIIRQKRTQKDTSIGDFYILIFMLFVCLELKEFVITKITITNSILVLQIDYLFHINIYLIHKNVLGNHVYIFYLLYILLLNKIYINVLNNETCPYYKKTKCF